MQDQYVTAGLPTENRLELMVYAGRTCIGRIVEGDGGSLAFTAAGVPIGCYGSRKASADAISETAERPVP